MLEKIGLPSKPSLRGSNWVVDASHCQGCSSQFTFINRKFQAIMRPEIPSSSVLDTYMQKYIDLGCKLRAA